MLHFHLIQGPWCGWDNRAGASWVAGASSLQGGDGAHTLPPSPSPWQGTLSPQPSPTPHLSLETQDFSTHPPTPCPGGLHPFHGQAHPPPAPPGCCPFVYSSRLLSWTQPGLQSPPAPSPTCQSPEFTSHAFFLVCVASSGPSPSVISLGVAWGCGFLHSSLSITVSRFSPEGRLGIFLTLSPESYLILSLLVGPS